MNITSKMYKSWDKKMDICCIDEKGTWRLSDLYTRIEALKQVLTYKGLQKGDKVAIIVPNSSSYIVSILAVLDLGGVVVPIDPHFPDLIAIDLITSAKCKFVCISSYLEDNYINKRLNINVLIEANGDWKMDSNIMFQELDLPVVSENDSAFILFTSGTSGHPNGVILTHEGVLTNVEAIIEYMNPTAKDIFYIAKSGVHCSTLIGEILVGLNVGASLIIKNPVVSPTSILKRCDEYSPTILFVNPTILKLITQVKIKKYNISSIRLIYTSGAIADSEILLKADSFFSGAIIQNVYGLSEAGFRVSAQRLDQPRKLGSVGKPLKHTEIEIRSSKGEICKPYEIGQILIKSKSTMKGYVNKGRTPAKFLNAWLLSGDLGYLDSDGELFVKGRADDMIIRSGHNIDPYRIEKIIKKIDGIEDCIVFGVPDKLNGNNIVCGVVQEGKGSININSIFEQCSLLLPSYECPQIFVEWDKLPTTLNGKHSRKLARNYFETSRMG